MDGFSIIKDFFTRMHCNFCARNLEPEGIRLLRHEKGIYLVNINCVHCERSMGIAVVSLESEAEGMSSQAGRRLSDPELTESDLERLSNFAPINYDDVFEAHQFFSNLEADWQKFLPERLSEEMRQLEITSEGESEAS